MDSAIRRINQYPVDKSLRKQWAISELLFVSVLKWVLALNYCEGNEFDLHKNTQLIFIWMVVHQDSLWNGGMQQLGNKLLRYPIDPMQKWPSTNYSFVFVLISLTSLVNRR